MQKNAHFLDVSAESKRRPTTFIFRQSILLALLLAHINQLFVQTA